MRKHLSWITMLTSACIVLAAPALLGQSRAGEEAAVRAAVLDYVEGIYNVEPERIERSVHPDLAKRGFYRPDHGAPYQEGPMTFEQLVQLAGSWNKEGRVDPATAPKEVIVFEVLDQTASVKLVADWGIDYMHLAKYDGRWQIVNVLWQQHPPTIREGSGQ